MEYAIFGALVVAFFVAIIVKDIFNDRKKRRLFEKELRQNYGVLRKREEKIERFLRIDRYFGKHPEEGQVDDVTWNDLGMDDVFRSMNHTYSATGEEYLYHVLRSAGKSKEELEEFETLVNHFAKEEDQRVYVQILMAKLGYMGKFSLYDYLDNLDYLGERNNKKAILLDLAFIPCIAIMPFFFSYGLIALVALMIFNVTTYFKEKNEIEPYIVSFQYVLKLLDAAGRLEKLPRNEKEETLEKILEDVRKTCKELEPLRRGSFWVVSGNGSLGGSNPADLLIDYLKMTLHIDLMQFNKMLNFLRGNIDKVDAVNTQLGKIEASIAVGAWRTGLRKKGEDYCIPKLWEGMADSLKITDAWHPLLQDPVKNSLETEKGVLITGSNASGKSTFLKTVAINALLAQTVHTCTASSYEAPYFRIYSSMALQDDLEGGDSYYVVEIKALKRILDAEKEPGRPVLCFVDEVLRGTNTVERIAASTQILKSLHKKSVLCFAATHDIELTELLKQDFNNYHFEEEIVDGDVIFQYKLLPGKATTRNAIQLLEIMGYDGEVIANARGMAERFVESGQWSMQ